MMGRSPRRLAAVTNMSAEKGFRTGIKRQEMVRTSVGSEDVVDVLDKVERRDDPRVEKCRVAEVVRLHDGGVQRGEIERRDRDVVVSLLGLDDRRTFVLLVRSFRLERRYDVTRLERLAVQLGDDFDLLSARQEVVEGDTRDSRHLDVVDEAHELVHDALREVGVFEAVDGESSTGFGGSVLEVGDDGVMDVFLLLPYTPHSSVEKEE